MEKEELLLLENQLCFSLYAASKEIIKLYQPFLAPLNLTYTQYLCLLVLWEEKSITVKELGNKLLLDSGTLTPLLKKMENNQYIQRSRSTTDERVVNITLTDKGINLKNKASEIPCKIAEKLTLDGSDLLSLKEKVDVVVDNFRKE